MFKFATRIDVLNRAGFSAPGTPRSVNEDNYIVIGNTIVIIDGATAVTPLTKNGLNAAAYTSRWVSKFVQQHEKITRHLTAEGFLHFIHAHFRKHIREEWPEAYKEGVRGPSAALALVRFHEDDTLSYANLSDCSILISPKQGVWQRISDPDEAHAACDQAGLAKLYAYAEEQGIPASEAAKTPFAKQLGEENRKNSGTRFFTFNATKSAKKGIYGDVIPLKGLHQILLMSDGMQHPEAEGEYKLTRTAQLCAGFGLKETWKFFKAMYDKDPHWEKFPRGKHMDDATAVLVTLHPRFTKRKKAA